MSLREEPPARSLLVRAERRTYEPRHPAGARAWERSGACQVELAKIDCNDARFQCRLAFTSDDLVASIRERGQHTPVLLWGRRSPYVIIDGFRRIEAIAALGGHSVLAAFEETVDETRAFALSFSENSRRKNLTAYDKANAIWQAMNRLKIPKRDAASLLGLSVRQVDRYLRLIGFDEVIREALTADRITMAHAVALQSASPADLRKWIDEVETSGLSSVELRRRLRRPRASRGRRIYLIREGKGFRLAIRYRHDVRDAEKRRIEQALRSALKLVAKG